MYVSRPVIVRRSRKRRSGLTLLEVLLSAGLGIILIGGIYAAIEQSWKMSASGKVEMERQQVARAVLRQITLDIRSATFSAKPSGETSSGTSGTTGGTTGGSGTGTGTGTGTSTGGSTDSSQSTLVAGEEETQWTTSAGIRGIATELQIDLSHPRYLSSLMAVNGQMPSELQTVTYAVASPTTVNGGSSLPATTSTRPDADGMGLMRMVTERFGLMAVGNTTAANSSTSGPGLTRQLAPEIAGIQFRYFNGLAWMTEWDSVAMGALPRAIEITIVFEPPQSQGVLTNTAVSVGTDQYRHVIPVPTSDPVLTEEAY